MTKLILSIILLLSSRSQEYIAKVRKIADGDFDLMNLGYKGNILTLGKYTKLLCPIKQKENRLVILKSSNMKRITLILLVIITSANILFSKEHAVSQDSLFNNSEIEEVISKNNNTEVQLLKMDIIKLETKIENLQNRHSEQATYYQHIISLIFWVVGFLGIVITVGFSLFIWVFKEPKIVFTKIMNARKEIKSLVRSFEIDLENEYKQQSTIFLLGKKGLYSYTSYDWEKIKIYAKLAENIKEEDRKSADWYFIGSINYHNGNYEDAIYAFKHAIELDKNKEYLEIAYKDLGNTYDELNRFSEAIEYYNKVLEINKNSEKAYNNLGIAYNGLGNFEKSLECFTKSLELNEKQGHIYTNLFEFNLTQNEEFNPKFVRKFKHNFKENDENNIKLYSIFEMLNIYKKIYNGVDNVSGLLESWKGKGYYLSKDSNYREIEVWINKQEDSKLKEDLLLAYRFFDQEKGNM